MKAIVVAVVLGFVWFFYNKERLIVPELSMFWLAYKHKLIL